MDDCGDDAHARDGVGVVEGGGASMPNLRKENEAGQIPTEVTRYLFVEVAVVVVVAVVTYTNGMSIEKAAVEDVAEPWDHWKNFD